MHYIEGAFQSIELTQQIQVDALIHTWIDCQLPPSPSSRYCSPEYTFPSQQEAISFATNTAFELVALHPRTLVVCGSYSVGKEKVFLGNAYKVYLR